MDISQNNLFCIIQNQRVYPLEELYGVTLLQSKINQMQTLRIYFPLPYNSRESEAEMQLSHVHIANLFVNSTCYTFLVVSSLRKCTLYAQISKELKFLGLGQAKKKNISIPSTNLGLACSINKLKASSSKAIFTFLFCVHCLTLWNCVHKKEVF